MKSIAPRFMASTPMEKWVSSPWAVIIITSVSGASRLTASTTASPSISSMR